MFIRNIALITLLALGSTTGIAQVKDVVPDKMDQSELSQVRPDTFEVRMQEYIKSHPDFLSDLSKAHEEEQQNISEPKGPNDSLKTFKFRPDYKYIQKEKKVGIYITEEIVIDFKSPQYRYLNNTIILATNKDPRKFDVIDGANKILSADPKANPNEIKRFMLLVSDAAVAEGDNRNTIFKSSQDIVDTYNTYKSHDEGMSSVMSILQIYTKELSSLRLKVGGPKSFRYAIKKYATFHQHRTGKTKEELAELDIEAENSADNIIHRECLFGVNDQSFAIETVRRQNFRKQ